MQLGDMLQRSMIHRDLKARQDRQDQLEEALALATTPGLMKSAGTTEVDLGTGRDIGPKTAGMPYFDQGEKDKLVAAMRERQFQQEERIEDRRAQRRATELQEKRGYDLKSPSLQLKTPGLQIAERSTVQGQPALAAIPVQSGTEGDEVRALGGGAIYNPAVALRMKETKDAMVDVKFTTPSGVEATASVPFSQLPKSMLPPELGGTSVIPQRVPPELGGHAVPTATKKDEQKLIADEYINERSIRILGAVADLRKRVSVVNVGWGSLADFIPESEAKNFAGDLKYLKANIGFREITEMRAASKTGGALGQVSDRELELLTNTLGNLDTRQDRKSFIKNLTLIEDSLKLWADTKRKYGFQPVITTEEGSVNLPSERKPGVTNVEDFMKKHGLKKRGF